MRGEKEGRDPPASTRKPYRVSKQRCPWSIAEHALFLEAIDRCVAVPLGVSGVTGGMPASLGSTLGLLAGMAVPGRRLWRTSALGRCSRRGPRLKDGRSQHPAMLAALSAPGSPAGMAGWSSTRSSWAARGSARRPSRGCPPGCIVTGARRALLTPPPGGAGAEPRTKVLFKVGEGRQPGRGAAAAPEEARRAPVPDVCQPARARRAARPRQRRPRRCLGRRGQRGRGLAGQRRGRCAGVGRGRGDHARGRARPRGRRARPPQVRRPRQLRQSRGCAAARPPPGRAAAARAAAERPACVRRRWQQLRAQWRHLPGQLWPVDRRQRVPERARDRPGHAARVLRHAPAGAHTRTRGCPATRRTGGGKGCTQGARPEHSACGQRPRSPARPCAQKREVGGRGAQHAEPGAAAADAPACGGSEIGKLYDLVGSLYEVGPEAHQRML